MVVINAVNTCQENVLDKLNAFVFQGKPSEVVDPVHGARPGALRVDFQLVVRYVLLYLVVVDLQHLFRLCRYHLQLRSPRYRGKAEA